MWVGPCGRRSVVVAPRSSSWSWCRRLVALSTTSWSTTSGRWVVATTESSTVSCSKSASRRGSMVASVAAVVRLKYQSVPRASGTARHATRRAAAAAGCRCTNDGAGRRWRAIAVAMAEGGRLRRTSSSGVPARRVVGRGGGVGVPRCRSTDGHRGRRQRRRLHRSVAIEAGISPTASAIITHAQHARWPRCNWRAERALQGGVKRTESVVQTHDPFVRGGATRSRTLRNRVACSDLRPGCPSAAPPLRRTQIRSR